jgi:hypothetical protein
MVGVPLLELVGDDWVDFDGGNGIEKRQSELERNPVRKNHFNSSSFYS